MWWNQHWLELMTLVSLVGYFVRLEMFIRSVDERERAHNLANEKRSDGLDVRVRELERGARAPYRGTKWKGGN